MMNFIVSQLPERDKEGVGHSSLAWKLSEIND